MVFVGYQPSQRLLQWYLASYLPIIEPHVASLLGGIVNTDMPHIRQLGSIASLILYNMDISCHIDLSGCGVLPARLKRFGSDGRMLTGTFLRFVSLCDIAKFKSATLSCLSRGI